MSVNNSVNQLAEVLKQKMPGHVYCAEPMKKHTSFKIGGPADILVQPQNADGLAQALAAARDYEVPVTILGNGSNVLVRDKGIRGLVIQLGNALKSFRQEGERLYFGAGYSLALASRKAWECGLSGMEFAVGIPGSIGGAVYMNAGAYNGEMKCVVESVRVMDMNGNTAELTAEDLQFGYRKTSLQQSGYIITEVCLKMQPGNKDDIKAMMDDFSSRRISKQPLEMPSAGSMFKRPPGYFAGTLIEQAGLKGYTVGGAQVSTKHAGFVVNCGNATAADVLQLIADVRRIIMEKAGVELHPEVLVIGEE
ncbi:MAG: UDP-N-acetylenolpyruvoylglucosamine reductase [Phascolarctobacterium sp.]|nr:MAG: UDP-N-acetylenolpyruvoylglucosamine reductase [Phascolarctobacterium sp.]